MLDASGAVHPGAARALARPAERFVPAVMAGRDAADPDIEAARGAAMRAASGRQAGVSPDRAWPGRQPQASVKSVLARSGTVVAPTSRPGRRGAERLDGWQVDLQLIFRPLTVRRMESRPAPVDETEPGVVERQDVAVQALLPDAAVARWARRDEQSVTREVVSAPVAAAAEQQSTQPARAVAVRKVSGRDVAQRKGWASLAVVADATASPALAVAQQASPDGDLPEDEWAHRVQALEDAGESRAAYHRQPVPPLARISGRRGRLRQSAQPLRTWIPLPSFRLAGRKTRRRRCVSEYRNAALAAPAPLPAQRSGKSAGEWVRPVAA